MPTTQIDPRVRLAAVRERVAQIGDALHAIQEEFDVVAEELGAPVCTDPRVQALLEEADDGS